MLYLVVLGYTTCDLKIYEQFIKCKGKREIVGKRVKDLRDLSEMSGKISALPIPTACKSDTFTTFRKSYLTIS